MEGGKMRNVMLAAVAPRQRDCFQQNHRDPRACAEGMCGGHVRVLFSNNIVSKS